MQQIDADRQAAANWRAFLTYAGLPQDTRPDVAANKLTGAEAALRCVELAAVAHPDNAPLGDMGRLARLMSGGEAQADLGHKCLECGTPLALSPLTHKWVCANKLCIAWIGRGL
jgi:hypothetical protein